MAIIVNGVELEMGDFLSQFGEVRTAFCDDVQIWPPLGGESFFSGTIGNVTDGRDIIKRINANAVMTATKEAVGIPRYFSAGAGVDGVAFIAGGNVSTTNQGYVLTRINRNNNLLSNEQIGEWLSTSFGGGARSGVNAMFHGGSNSHAGDVLQHIVFNKEGGVVRALATLTRLSYCSGSDNLLTTNAFFYGAIKENTTSDDIPNKLDIISTESTVIVTEKNIGINGGTVGRNAAAVGAVSIFYGGTRQVEGGSQHTNAVLRLNVLGNQVGIYTYVGQERDQVNGSRSDDVTVWHAGGITGSRTNTTTLINEDGTQRGIEVNLGNPAGDWCAAVMSF